MSETERKSSRANADELRSATKREKKLAGEVKAQRRADLAAKLRKLREDLGLYQHEVARKLKPPIWPQQLAKWETAALNVPGNRLVELAAIYGVDMKDLLDGPEGD